MTKTEAATDSDSGAEEQQEFYARVRRVFAFMAPFYNILVIPLSKLRTTVVDFTRALAGSRVLDVATGTGKQAFAFAKKQCEVVGIDLSEAMLRVAKQNAADLKLAIADAAKLPFAAQTFDACCISFALHDMPLRIRARAVAEMARVMKPNGSVVIVDYALPDSKIRRFLIYHLVRLYEGRDYPAFIRCNLEGLLRDAGLEVREEIRALFGAVRVLKALKTQR